MRPHPPSETDFDDTLVDEALGQIFSSANSTMVTWGN